MNPTLAKLLEHQKLQKDPAVWATLDRRPDKRDRASGELLAEGAPLASLLNIEKVITNDKRWHGAVRLNQLTGTILMDGHELQDEHTIRAALWMDRIYDMKAKPSQVADVLRVVAEANAFHPVQDYLGTLEWDGTPRIDGLLSDYLGADDTPLHRAISRCFLISCVARALKPGCKVDTSLVLQGKQGSLKSTFFRTLCADPAWFKDTPIDLRNKDAMQGLQGVWIYEFAELDSIRPRESTTTKAFLSSQVDTYRPPYNRAFVRRPRQCVIVGTTNDLSFLNDHTGARRFWPVSVTDIDIAAVERDRQQLWAEAAAAFTAGATWWLDDDMGDELADASAQFAQVDPWSAPIAAWLFDGAGPRVVTNPDLQPFEIHDVLHRVLELPSAQQGRGAQMRVAAILSELGCHKSRRRWQPVPTSGASVPTSAQMSQPRSVRQWRWVSPKMQII